MTISFTILKFIFRWQWVILPCLLFSHTVLPQSKNIQAQLQFKSLTINDGLSNNHVNAIYQDDIGFIWFATENGLDRFDGYQVVSYRYNPDDSTSILSNSVKVVYSDSKKNMWVGGAGGLNLFNSDLENFKEFTHKDLKEPVGLVEDIVEDRNGIIWIGASNGLYSFDLNTLNLCHYKHDPVSAMSLPGDFAFSLMVDSRNNLWISILNEGFCIFDQTNQTMTCFRNNPNNQNSVSGNRIERFYEDSKGNIWIGTYNNGLNLYHPKTSTFTRFIPDQSNSYSTRVRAIFEDNGDLFIGTRGGLYLKDQDKRTFIYYAHSSHGFSTLSQNSILCHFIDRSGCLWLGTYSGGANYSDLNRKKFIHYKAEEDKNLFLRASNIYSIIEDDNENLWVGTENGLNYLDRTTGIFSYFMHDPANDNSLSYDDVKALELDDKRNLWIGTNNGGLDCYDIKKRRFKHYRHNPDDPASLSGDKIYKLFIDSEENLWIMTNEEKENRNSDIQLLRKNSDRFIHLNEKGYFGITESRTGDIWLGGMDGIWHFDKKDSVFAFIENDVMIGKVYCIYEDTWGVFWIGSEKGLARYDYEKNLFSHFSEHHGHPLSFVYGILEDSRNNLWISTDLGLVKFINAVSTIESPEFIVYDQDDGLQSKQFNYGAYYKSRSGEMFFGGINGFDAFYPDEIRENPYKPLLAITNLKIFNKTVPIGKEFRDRIVLKKSITQSDELILSDKDDVFTLEFSALHYANPSRNQYAYILEGFEKDWNDVGAQRTATYTNLDPGRYTFRVKAANYDGIWNEQGKSLRIVITPPFWQTWWFRIISLITIALCVYGIIDYRIHGIRRQRKKLEALVEKRTRDLSAANMALKRSNEELKQFAYVASHDLQEPLRMISSYMKLLERKIQGTLDADSKEFFDYAIEGAQRMHIIINDLLLFSRVSTKVKPFKETDLNQLIDNVIHNMEVLIEEYEAQISYQQLPTVLCDSIQFEQLFQNLLVNAMKFCRKTPVIQLSSEQQNGYWIVSLKDNGIGIDPEYQDNIFGIFKRLHQRDEYSGTGIGLAICKKIVEQHGGKIWVESEGEGKGSTFYFTIPVV